MNTLYQCDITSMNETDLKNIHEATSLYGQLHALVTLQGLLNRIKPTLYLRAVQSKEADLNIDDFWLDWLRQDGHLLEDWTVEPLPDPTDVFLKFAGQASGIVLYSMDIPALSLAASTVCGLEDAIALPDTPECKDLLHLLHNKCGLRVIHRLSQNTIEDGSSDTDKIKTYKWLLNYYKKHPKSDFSSLAYFVDCASISLGNFLKHHDHFPGYPDAPNWNLAERITFFSNQLPNYDWFISHRAFFFDLSPWEDEPATDDPEQESGADYRMLQEILLASYEMYGKNAMTLIGGFVPWPFKYNERQGGNHSDVDGEWQFTAIISSYNAYLEADAFNHGVMANASVFQHQPLANHYPQPAHPPASHDSDDDPEMYLCFYVGDYDSPAWLYRLAPTLWQDPARGNLPLGWAINPNLAQRMAPAMIWMRDTATPMDYFLGGDSGAGYVVPATMQEPRPFSGLPDGMDVWRKHCTRFYKQWDLSHTGFVIDGITDGMNEEGLKAYSEFSGDGIATHYAPEPPVIVNGMPVLKICEHIQGCHEDEVAEAVNRIVRKLDDPGHPQFLYCRTICKTPDFHAQIVRKIEERVGSRIRFVDPVTFFSLIKEEAR